MGKDKHQNRIRTIKPELFENEKFGKLSDKAKLIFIGSITRSCDEGIIRWTPEYIKVELFWYENISNKIIKKAMKELEDINWIQPYYVEEYACHYALITTFTANQRIDKPKPTPHPRPPEITDTIQDSILDDKQEAIQDEIQDSIHDDIQDPYILVSKTLEINNKDSESFNFVWDAFSGKKTSRAKDFKSFQKKFDGLEVDWVKLLKAAQLNTSPIYFKTWLNEQIYRCTKPVNAISSEPFQETQEETQISEEAIEVDFSEWRDAIVGSMQETREVAQ